MRNKRLISIIALVAVVFALTVGSVSAFQPRADLASVWTTSDLSGHVNANSFTIGQTAYIW